MYHFFLVDLNDRGEMYRVGVASDSPTAVTDIKKYLKQYSKDVLYEETKRTVKNKFLKTSRSTPVGEIFFTHFLFNKTLKTPYDHWTSELRRKLLKIQSKGMVIYE